jgi:NADP-dependent 3-hydroxy acid dehydrogenase YdfG
MMQQIENKTAFITGGTKGIGYGIARAMLNENMKVLITGRNAQTVADAVDRLNGESKGGEAIGMAADVRDAAAQQKCVERIVDTWGKLDVLVANAGLGHFASIEEMSADQWKEMVDINLTGVFNSMKASIEPLKKSKGYIFTIASLAGTNFFAGGSGYNATKFGLVGFTQAVMLDLRHQGVKVSTIMPGSVSTHFNSHTPGHSDDWKIQIEDIGQIVVDVLRLHPRTLPSKIEVRPSMPPKK